MYSIVPLGLASERGERAAFHRRPSPRAGAAQAVFGAMGASPPRENRGGEAPHLEPLGWKERVLRAARSPGSEPGMGVERWGASTEPGTSPWWSSPVSLTPALQGTVTNQAAPSPLQSISHQEHSTSEDKRGHRICFELPTDLWFQGQLCPKQEKYDV